MISSFFLSQNAQNSLVIASQMQIFAFFPAKKKTLKSFGSYRWCFFADQTSKKKKNWLIHNENNNHHCFHDMTRRNITDTTVNLLPPFSVSRRATLCLWFCSSALVILSSSLCSTTMSLRALSSAHVYRLQTLVRSFTLPLSPSPRQAKQQHQQLSCPRWIALALLK